MGLSVMGQDATCVSLCKSLKDEARKWKRLTSDVREASTARSAFLCALEYKFQILQSGMVTLELYLKLIEVTQSKVKKLRKSKKFRRYTM